MNLIDQITDWHDRFKSWKPLHWCWWFRKHGLPIPKYLIGGGSVLTQRNWIIGDDDNSDPDLCTFDLEDTARIDQAKELNFMVRFQVGVIGGSANNLNYNVAYNTIDDPDTASLVTTAGSIVKISSGTPTDGDPTTENKCSAQVETWANGLYEDNADETGKYSLDEDYYTEFQFCVQFTPSAGDGTDYFFWLFHETVAMAGYNSPTCKVTTEAAGTLYYEGMAGSFPAQDGVLTRKAKFPRVQIGDFDGSGVLARKTTQGRFQDGAITGGPGVVARKGTLSRFQDGVHGFAGEVYRVFTAPRSVAGAFDMAGTVVGEIVGAVTEFMEGAFGATGVVTRVVKRFRKITGQL